MAGRSLAKLEEVRDEIGHRMLRQIAPLGVRGVTQEAAPCPPGVRARRDALDLRKEATATRELYGHTLFGQSCLAARRLAADPSVRVTVGGSRRSGAIGSLGRRLRAERPSVVRRVTNS